MSCPFIFLLENAPVAVAFMALNLVYFFVMFARYLVFDKAEGPTERGLYLIATTIMYVIFAIIGNGIFWRALLVEFLAIFAIFTAITAVVIACMIVVYAYMIVWNIVMWFFDFFFGVDLYNFELMTLIKKLFGKEKTTSYHYDDDDTYGYHYHY